MRMGQGVRTGLRHEGITCVLQNNFLVYFSTKTYVVAPQNRLGETVLMMGHKICYYKEIWLIIKYLCYPFLSGTLLFSTSMTSSLLYR